jgi:hypothetical protein
MAWTIGTGNRVRPMLVVAALLAIAGSAAAFRAPELTPEQEKDLKQNFSLSVSKLKGPYTENTCVCPNGTKRPIRSASGALGAACEKPIFCAAYRAPWGEALAKQQLYLGNIFSRDVYEWDGYADHNNLVRGYVLEKYFVETNPQHKLAQLRNFRGLASAEEEAPAAAKFFERYLAAPEFDEGRHFLLAYELQRRFFVAADMGQIQQVRSAAVRVESMDPRFKPLKDAIHNQVSAGLLAPLAEYRDKLPQGTERSEIQGIMDQIQKLTSIDEKALEPQIAAIQDETLRGQLKALVPAESANPVDVLSALAQLMVTARQTVAAKKVSTADQRRLIDLTITAATVLNRRGTALLESKTGLTAKQNLQVLTALTNATYAVGLLNLRERDAALGSLQELIAKPNPGRKEFSQGLEQAERVVEWAQANATLPFAEVWAQWTYLMPQVAGIGDDILRGSPLLIYAKVARRLDDFASGGARVKHDFFGKALDADVRALNPGLALSTLRVAPKGGFTRDEIVALPDTPADLEPAAGILTKGEGNVLSHVQLLARALGIPNVVLGQDAYDLLKPHDGKKVLLISTPGGRVILKEASAMTDEDRLVYEEFTRNDKRGGDGSLQVAGPKLHIDKAKIDLGPKLPINLDDVRRKDSGVMCGPKAAYLGELKHFFPDHVARGIVVPFGAYHAHYLNAPVSVPEKLRSLNIAKPGEPLPGFVERTYAEFFGKLIPSKMPEKQLTAWIDPRLAIIRQSIEDAPLAKDLTDGIKSGLDSLGLLKADDKSQTVGCFVRSDTNVEDLDSFNGAGLNLTVFNRKSLADIGSALKEVWASPFELRSFSWRQTLIDEPLWVLPSVVILESVPNDKSGVLVTGDIYNGGDPGKMTVATSEGVGGAVDGTSAETLLWSPAGVEIVTLFKSPWRNQLQASGGSAVVPASGSATVLPPQELEQLIAAGKTITEKFEATRDPAGRPRPWDVEFGFSGGKLWLFQCRPFIGNDSLKNVPALAALEGKSAATNDAALNLEEILK